jgi:hypothetical protein
MTTPSFPHQKKEYKRIDDIEMEKSLRFESNPASITLQQPILICEGNLLVPYTKK